MKKQLPDHLNKRSKLKKEDVEKIEEMYKKGISLAEIGRTFGITINSVKNRLGILKRPSQAGTWKKYYNKEENTKRRREYRARLKAAEDGYPQGGNAGN